MSVFGEVTGVFCKVVRITIVISSEDNREILSIDIVYIENQASWDYMFK